MNMWFCCRLFVSHRYLDQSSNTECLIWRYMFHWGESVASWTMVALNADRFASMTIPFWARTHLTPRYCNIAYTVQKLEIQNKLKYMNCEVHLEEF